MGVAHHFQFGAIFHLFYHFWHLKIIKLSENCFAPFQIIIDRFGLFWVSKERLGHFLDIYSHDEHHACSKYKNIDIHWECTNKRNKKKLKKEDAQTLLRAIISGLVDFWVILYHIGPFCAILDIFQQFWAI
jgi:hypothetical protein